MKRRAAPRIGALLLLCGAACTSSDTPETPSPEEDAGLAAPVPSSRVETAELSYMLPAGWIAEVPPAATGDIETLALARRTGATGEPEPKVAPRLELTREPADGSIETEVARVKADLERRAESSGAKVERSSASVRMRKNRPTARVEVRFRVGDGARGVRLVLEALVILPAADAEGPGDMLTLTASYLEMDRARVGPEVEQIFERLVLSVPQSGSNP